MEATNNNSPANAEEGLDELLDSCLDDFNKPLPKPATSVPLPTSGATTTEAKPSNADAEFPDQANWGEEFKQFHDVMENFLENEGDLSEFRNLIGAFDGRGVDNSGLLADGAFDQSFVDTIRGLTEGAQNIPQMSPDELAGIFNNFDLNDPNSGDPDQLPELMPFMHNVMQRLMSKELLYPSLKEIVDKYPSWLADKRSSLKTDEYNKYSEQYNLMKSVCDAFENENESDSDEIKKERFEKVLMLMQKIQNCGNPPKDLVSDISQNVPLDEHGNLQIPGMPQQCTIM